MDRPQEVSEKLGRVRSWLAAAGLQAVVLGSQANFAWITAGGHSYVATSAETGVGSVVITADLAAVVCPNIETSRLVEEELPPGCFEVAEYPWDQPERRNRIIDEMAGGGQVVADLPDPKRQPAGPELTELRRVLLEPEIERYRALALDAAHVLESACRSVAMRESELDTAGRLADLCIKKNMLPVVNLVAADERFPRYRHPLPTANRVDRTMLVVLTARRHGLHASVSRTLCFGKPDDDQLARHQACCRVDARFILSSVPGGNLKDVFAAGANHYAAEGFPDEWKLHHQGGLTGYAGRELKGSPTSDYVLRANQALAWNPSITGAKSEDTILIGNSGVEVLTTTGHWPMFEAVVNESSLMRPDLLIL
jgi:Xaa-Pro aminopeptidase